MKPRGPSKIGAGLLLALSCSACGYQAGISIAPEYQSVGVEIFGRDGRDAPVVNLERDLHEQILRSTANLVEAEILQPSRAQLVMRGSIESYHRRSGVRSSDSLQLETGITMVVQAELWDRVRDVLVSGPISASTEVGYTLDALDAELRARRRLLHNLSDRIVLDLMLELEPPADPGSLESGEAPMEGS